MGHIFHSCNAKWKAHCCIMMAILTYLLWGHSCVPQARAQSTENIAPPTEQTERVKTVVHLYFLNSSKNFLTAEERVIARSPDPQEFSAQIVAELINGPQKELIATVPQLRCISSSKSIATYHYYSLIFLTISLSSSSKRITVFS